MSMDDCFIPFHSPLREPTAYDRWGKGPQPCWSQLDLERCAVGAGGSQGQGGVDRRILRFLNRPVVVPPRRPPPPLGPLPKVSPAGSKPSQHKENLPEEPKQHHPAQAAVSSAASRGRYARSRAGWASKERSTPCIRSRAGCASMERSTPEGVNMAEHGFRFRFTFPQPKYEYGTLDFGEDDEDECLPRQRKPPEVRNALREKRVAFRQKAARHHAKVALRKYNRANNTKFELVEVRVIRQFWEFGGGCIHYNFTARPEDHHSADADSTKLFFSEVDNPFHGENDVLLCCIVGENDNGHCYGCEGYKPTVVHPSSQAYGGGSSTCIDFAGSDGSSESD